jgi:hypothetical protein
LPKSGDDHPRPNQPIAPAQTESTGWAQFGAAPGLYEALFNNQRDATWWKNCADVEMLRGWQALFIREFDLRVKYTQYMGPPLIRIEPMNIRTIGAYRTEADGYALAGTLGFNQKRLDDLPAFITLAELVRLLLRAWQHQNGGDGTFDKQCREHMKAMGLVINGKGTITIDEHGRFRRVLTSRGVEVPLSSLIPPPRTKAKSTLKPWSCRCQKFWVGTKDFVGNCPVCDQPFREGDHVGKRLTTGLLEEPNWQI